MLRAGIPWGVGAFACAAALAQNPIGDRCACPDGRVFSLGAALFGQNSARVIVAGFEPALTAGTGSVPRCGGIQVLGQTVEMHRSSEGRQYLQRENRKRGMIRDVCRTQIRFVQQVKSYNFFADDGNAVTLDGNAPADPAPAIPAAGDFSEDLTGKDLLQFDTRSRPHNPAASAFDQDDLKETAYIIVRKRVKATAFTDSGTAAGEVSVGAGMLGRIEKRAGARSEPLWNIELFPDSAPAPFWRALAASLRRGQTANRAILASSEIVEINHFLDRYRAETTRFGESRRASEPGTMDLPKIFSKPKLRLDENIAEAEASGAVMQIEGALAKLALLPKERHDGLLILDESGHTTNPDLFRPQCFIEAKAPGERLSVSEAAVKVFRPATQRIAPDYYAIDLEMSLRSSSQNTQETARIVCRFPFDPIGMDLVNRARRILSARFRIEP